MCRFRAAFALILMCAAQAQAAPPHIVVMIADDLGWGDVGFHGSRVRTPNIDRLAARGVQLNQFYVQPVCSPTRGAFLTGRYPMRLGLQCGVVRPWADYGLPLNERTLPQALHEAGYKTAIVGKWHLGHSRSELLPLQRGFDLQYGHYNGAIDYFKHDRDGGHDWHRNDRRSDDQGYSTDLLGQAAAEIIAQNDPANPLFLYVPFNAVHTPIQAPEQDIEAYSSIKDKQRAIYAAMTTRMDLAVGRILEALSTHNYATDNTLILFTSDNGGVLRYGSNGVLSHEKGTLYEGGVRVPSVIAWDGKLQAGTMVDEPLHIVDLYPTLLKLAGVSLEQALPLDGLDAWPTIAEGQPTPHEFILHNVTPFHGAVRMGDWKLVHNGHVGANVVQKSPIEKWELFNIREDISETTDLRQSQPEVFARLKAKLEQLESEAATPNIAPNRAPDDFQTPKVWGEF